MSKDTGYVFKHEKYEYCFTWCIIEDSLMSVCAARHRQRQLDTIEGALDINFRAP